MYRAYACLNEAILKLTCYLFIDRALREDATQKLELFAQENYVSLKGSYKGRRDS
jgi:hypothetical protein